jgi:steroid delta-isomerase-like uncharacterized protein
MTKRALLLAAALLLIAGCGSGADETAEIIAAVEANETAYIEAWQAQDLDALMDVYTDDVVFVDETFGDYIEGKDRVRSMYSYIIKFADPDGKDVFVRFVSPDGKWAASTGEWVGTNFNGNRFDLPTALIHEYRDGKIVRETVYYASPDARAQLSGSGTE